MRRRRISRLGLVAVLSTATLTFSASTALGYWSGNGGGMGDAFVTTLLAPVLSATPEVEAVQLRWNEVKSPEPGVPVTYYVKRDGGTPSIGCPTESTPSPLLGCTDTGLAGGSKHTYVLVAQWRSWRAESEPQTVTVAFSGGIHFQLEAASSTVNAGEADPLTIVAKDGSGNTVTTFSGSHRLTFEGASPAPNGTAPTVTGEGGAASDLGEATAIKFTEGKATVSGTSNGLLKLYRAEEAHIRVTEGTINSGAGIPIAVKPGAFKSLGVIPSPAEPTAGQSFEAKLVAYDEWQNPVTSYTRTHKLRYEGAESSPSGKAPEYPANTEPTFANGEATLTGFRFYKAAATTLKVTEEVTGHAGQATFNVKAAAAKSFSLAAAATEVGSGQADSLTITALDEWSNIASGYGGAAGETKSLTFEGAGVSPNGNSATVTNSTGAAKKFGEATAIKFTEGKAAVTGTSNGQLTLYKIEEAHVKVTEGAISNGAGLAIKVKAGEAKSFKLSAPSVAEPEAGQAFNVTITALDAGGNTATSYGGAAGANKTIAYSGPEASPSGKAPEYPATATTVKFKEGVGTATRIKLYRAAATTLTAKEGTVQGSVGFTVKAKAAASLSLKFNPTEAGVGEPDELTISALDTYGNVATTYAGAKSLTFSGPGKGPDGQEPFVVERTGTERVFGRATSINFTAGQSKVESGRNGLMTLFKAETAHVKVTAGTLTNGGRGQAITVGSGQPVAYKLSAPKPAEPEASKALSITLTAVDAYGNTVKSYGGAAGADKKIGWEGAESSPSGKAPEYPATATTIDFKEGVGTATGIKLYRAGTTTLVAWEKGGGVIGAAAFGPVAAAAVAPLVSGTELEGSVTFTVKPGAFKSFGVIPSAAEPNAGQNIEAKLVAWDEWHNTLTSYTRTHKLRYEGAESSPSGKAPEYPANTEPTFANGEATLTGFRFYKAAATTLKVTEEVTGHAGQATFNVKAGAVRNLGVIPSPSEVRAGEGFEAKLVAYDEWQNPVTSYTRTHKLRYEGAESSPSGKAPEYPANTEPTFANGEATLTGFRFYKAAATTLKVTEEVTGVTGQGTVTVTPAGLGSFAVSAPSVAEPEAGQAFDVTLTAIDSYGNIVTSYGGEGGANKTIAYSGPEASPSGKAPEYPRTATRVRFTEGVGTATGIKLYRAGATTLDVAEGGLEGSVSLTVKGAAASTFTLSAPSIAEPEAGQAFNVTVTAKDPYGNDAKSYGGPAGADKALAFSGPGASPNGKAPEYPATVNFREGVGTATGIRLYKAAATTLTAKEGALEGAVGFTVKTGVAKSFKLSGPSVAEPEAGQAFNVTITALDAGGNTATSYGGAAGANKTIAYSGPEASPSGKAPEYPATATTVNFKEGVGTATAIKLYRAATTTLTAKEGAIEGAVGFTVKGGAASSFRLAPSVAEPEAGQAFDVTITALDAGGNTATSYGGAAGANKTIAYSGPEASPNGKAPEYPATATKVKFKEGVGTATAIKLYRAAATTLTAKEGAIEGAANLTVKGGAVSSFKLAAPSVAEPEAGQAFNVTITALDAGGNTATSYGGAAGANKTIAYSGPEASPSGKAPEYPATATTVNFKEGVGTATAIKLYRAATTTLTAKEGTVEGAVGFAVKPGAFKSLGVIPSPAEPTAGQSFEAKLVAYDEWQNPVTSYTRTHKLRYEGAESSPSGKAPEYPANTEPTFANGEATLTGFRFYKAAATTLKVTEEVTGHAGQATFNVKAAAAKSFSLAAAATEVGSGQADSLTITALDEWSNIASGYGGAAGETKSLTFEGAGVSPNGNSATVTNSTGAAKKFGEATAIKFTEGKAAVTGTSNGQLTLYKIEEAHVKVTEGAISNGAGLAIKVKAGEAKSFKLSAPSVAEPEAGQAFNVTITALDAGGNTATSYGGAAGANKTIAYSGPEASPSGKAPEYPATATTVNFKEGVGTATAIKLYRAATTTLTAKEGTVEGAVGFTVKAAKAVRLAWSEPKVSAGALGSPCLFTCTAEKLGSEGKLTAKVAVTDEWGNLQPSHGAAITVALASKLVHGGGLGGGLSATNVTIAAAAASSGTFTFTASRLAPPTVTSYEYTLEASATGYTGTDAAKATLTS